VYPDLPPAAEEYSLSTFSNTLLRIFPRCTMFPSARAALLHLLVSLLLARERYPKHMAAWNKVHC